MLKEAMNIVIVGHVDHGKSTVIGRLLADTNSLPQGKLEQIKKNCEKNSKPFEYAFLLDALIDEQDQGITIDSARVFFHTKKRNYIIIDAPGHIEFLKNMISGAARAEAALLVIDAEEGVRENSRRHGYMLSMLGIKQIAILINKMDLKAYSKEVFDDIVKEYSKFLKEINITPITYIPVSAINGDCIANISKLMPWYNGKTVLDILDSFETEPLPVDKPFRMPVQGIYKFTKYGDNRRIVAGTVNTGKVVIGDSVVFFPSGKKSRVKTIESFNSKSDIKEVHAGDAAGFTLEEQIYVKRGEIAVKQNEQAPKVTTRIQVSLFWLGKEPMIIGKEYFLKLGTAKISVKIEKILRVLDASNLSSSETNNLIARHDVSECILKLNKSLAFDLNEDIIQLSRFVIIDNYEIAGGGIIRSALEDQNEWIREKIFMRNYKWEQSMIPVERRAEKYNQKSFLVIITGQKNIGKKIIAKELETQLFNDGKIVYFLGIGNIVYGVDADIKGIKDDRSEHIRRLAEVAHIILDAGVILIVTAVELNQDDLNIIKSTIDNDKIEVVWLGDKINTNISIDTHVSLEELSKEEIVGNLKETLQEKGIIFRPW